MIAITPRFALVLITLTLSPSTILSTDMVSYDDSERNREAMENHIGPVLYSLGGVARLYTVEKCHAGDCPKFPRIKMRPAPKGAVGLTGVRQIFSSDKQTVVTSGPNGIIRIRYGGAPSPLLQTKIRSLRLTSLEQYNIIEAEAALEATTEFKDALKKLRLEEPVTVVSELVQEPMEGVPHLPQIIRDVTVDEALDLFAKTFGEVVRYMECIRPDGTRCYIINHSYVQGGKWFDALRARWDKLREEGFKTDICPVHHVRLEHSPIYEWSHWSDDNDVPVPPDPRPNDPPDSFFRREEQYPMRLGCLERRTPSKTFREKKIRRFCPACQRLFEADLQRYSVRNALFQRGRDVMAAPLGDQH